MNDMERFTEYHAGKAVIKYKDRHGETVEKLARYEDLEEQKRKAEESRVDFPILRNNDQRKDFLKEFHDWPIWFEVPEASETYYRCNLPDGSSIVICEYNVWIEWKERYTEENPDSLGTRMYLLKPGYHYLADCKVSKNILVGHLKDVQKEMKRIS